MDPLEQAKKMTFDDNREMASRDATTVALQNMTISQLTEQVSIIKMENKQILDSLLFGFTNGSLYELTFSPAIPTPCWRPHKWIWQSDMMRRHSSQSSEAHLPLCSAVRMEPPIHSLLEPPLDKGVSSTGGHSTWGNLLDKKTLSMLCVFFQNIDSLSQTDDGEVKLIILQQLINQFEIDIVGLAEPTPVGMCLIMISICSKTAHWSLGFNQMDTHQACYQPRGMGLLAVNAIAHWVQSSGDDNSGMGWWCWICIQGKGNHFTRFVGMYQACNSREPTTYQQQVRALVKQGRDIWPQQEVLDDLVAAIHQWQDDGNEIIVLIDFNNDIQDLETVHYFSTMGLQAVHLEAHSIRAPPTHRCGQHPIDGIYGPSHLIEGVPCSYLAFGNGVPSDHWGIWVDLPSNSFVQCCVSAWQLQCQDPHVIEQYNQFLGSQLALHNILACV